MIGSRLRLIYRLSILSIFVLTISSPLFTADAALQWESKTQLISNFRALVKANPSKASELIVGRTLLGGPIWMFTLGTGVHTVMIDGAIHGNEIRTSHNILYLAQWLLSDSSTANAMLSKLKIYLIPIINYDNFAIERKNEHLPDGVDLNRNFKYGWGLSGNSDKYSDNYRGAFAASEPETQIMRTLFAKYKPEVYINIHDGGGNPTTKGLWLYSKYISSTTYNPLYNLYASTVKNVYGLTPMTMGATPAVGYAKDDAYALSGAISVLWEETYYAELYGAGSLPELIYNVKRLHLISYIRACAAYLA